MTRLLELRQLEYDMLELCLELSDEQYRALLEECSVAEENSVSDWYNTYLEKVWRMLVRVIRIHEERIGLITVEVVDTGWCPSAEFWNAACQASKNTYKED